MELVERAGELLARVVGPLVLGGPLRPVRPLGPELGLELGQVQHGLDEQLWTQIDQVRLRRARRLVSVDGLPPRDGAELALAAGLNDLLQVTNEELSTFATRSRHAQLLEATERLCTGVPPAPDLYQAVARHGLLGRVLELRRTDTEVSWWTGSAVFRGQAPPDRLLRWPSLRRVRVERATVPLAEMAAWAPVPAEAYQRALGTLLSASPLTDLATAARDQPGFCWTHHTLAVVATPAGQNLALRAFAHQEPSVAVWARTCVDTGSRAADRLAQAAGVLPPGSAARAAADGYVTLLREAVHAWTSTDSAA